MRVHACVCMEACMHVCVQEDCLAGKWFKRNFADLKEGRLENKSTCRSDLSNFVHF